MSSDKNIVLQVQNLSKQYRLGTVGTGTLSHDLNKWWHQLRGKEDPYLKLGTVNDRTKVGGDYVWALNDVNFEVQKGEVLGIIGKNGAGKSTLLKLLSQITTPTKGQINIKGRVASLLEVGTGFHPELTGRENIYLNGAILGMTKSEIRSKIDEIIDFSGCAKYIDTPVKRYSSGMMVRLGFAVAAHLEPEILVIDEVLAVGDAEFQNKCIGKMQDVSKSGRTVLFVSHNMESVSRLCTRGLIIDKGTVSFSGDVSTCVAKYFDDIFTQMGQTPISERTDRKGHGAFRYQHVRFVKQGKPVSYFTPGSTLQIELLIAQKKVGTHYKKAYPSIIVYDSKGNRISSWATGLNEQPISLDKQETWVRFSIDKLQLAPGRYICNLHLDEDSSSNVVIDKLERAFELTIEDGDYYGKGFIHGKNMDTMFCDFYVNQV